MAGAVKRNKPVRHSLTEYDRQLLDGKLFPHMFGQQPDTTRHAINVLCNVIAVGAPVSSHSTFAACLRSRIAFLRNELGFIYGEDKPSPEEVNRLRSALDEAITHIEGWVARHGIDRINTSEEDTAARQGWPDETGTGWTPPWDELGMTAPDYWGTPAKTA